MTAPATTAPAAAAAASACPLTAEQVGSELGAALQGPDSSCSFNPSDDKLRPNATYVKQVPFACSGNVPAENDHTEKVDGLGVTAYVNEQADGSWVLVCRSGAPFEIRVDIVGGAQPARAAAIALAKIVLGGR